MPGLLDDQEITIPCPTCEREIPITVADVRRSPKLTCACGQDIAIDASEFNSEMRKVDDAEKRLDDSIKRLNGTIIGG